MAIVLNVESDENVRCARSRVLTDTGYRVFEAGTIKDVTRLALSLDPHLIVLGGHLNGDGLALCQTIKLDPATAQNCKANSMNWPARTTICKTTGAGTCCVSSRTGPRRTLSTASCSPILISPSPNAPHRQPVMPERMAVHRPSYLIDPIHRLLLDRYAPAAVFVNLQGQIVYIHGRTGAYLEPAPGLASQNVVDMAREDLRPELVTASGRIADAERGIAPGAAEPRRVMRSLYPAV